MALLSLSTVGLLIGPETNFYRVSVGNSLGGPIFKDEHGFIRGSSGYNRGITNWSGLFVGSMTAPFVQRALGHTATLTRDDWNKLRNMAGMIVNPREYPQVKIFSSMTGLMQGWDAEQLTFNNIATAFPAMIRCWSCGYALSREDRCYDYDVSRTVCRICNVANAQIANPNSTYPRYELRYTFCMHPECPCHRRNLHERIQSDGCGCWVISPHVATGLQEHRRTISGWTQKWADTYNNQGMN